MPNFIIRKNQKGPKLLIAKTEMSKDPNILMTKTKSAKSFDSKNTKVPYVLIAKI